MKAAQFAAAIADSLHPTNTDARLSLEQPDHGDRAKERLGATVALLEAAIPDPFQRIAIINEIVNYGTERALGAIDSMAERWQRSLDRSASR